MKILLNTFFVLFFGLVQPLAVFSKAADLQQLQTDIYAAVKKAAPTSVAIVNMYGTFSGVIVSKEGHILSAGHAVEPGKKYPIILNDGRKFEGVGLGIEQNLDMGMIKITDPQNLPVAEMGWSATLQPNQPCLSISHPSLYDEDRGLVVRFGRITNPLSIIEPRVAEADPESYIESTCLMEPGDSGGPLYDINGRLIAIHSQIRAPLEKNFDVPVDHFRRYWSQLIEGKEFNAKTVKLNPDFGLELFKSPPKVKHLAKKGMAEKAGLKKHDAITAVNGKKTENSLEVIAALQNAYILGAKQITMTVERKKASAYKDQKTNAKHQATAKSEIEKIQISFKLPKNQSAKPWHQNTATVIEPKPDKSLVKPIDNSSLLTQLRMLEAQLDEYVVELESSLNGQSIQSLSTLIAPGDLLIGVNSQVGSNANIKWEGKKLPAEVIYRDKKQNLVLLKLKQKIANGIAFKQLPNETRQGEMLLSPMPQDNGFFGVSGSRVFDSKDVAFLGVGMDDDNGNIVIRRIVPDSPASEQLKVGDYLLSVNGIKLDTAETFVAEVLKFEGGDTIKYTAERDGKTLNGSITLESQPEHKLGHIAEKFPGGTSKKAKGFKRIFTHDSGIPSDRIGAPIFNLQKEFIGINIARKSRTQTYAILASQVEKFVKQAVNQ